MVKKDKQVLLVLENLLTSSFKITCLESYIDFANKLWKINFGETFLWQNKITMQHWTHFFKISKVKAKMMIKQIKSPNVSPTLAFWAEWNIFKTFHAMAIWYIDVSQKKISKIWSSLQFWLTANWNIGGKISKQAYFF